MPSCVKIRLNNDGIFYGSEHLNGQAQLKLKAPAAVTYLKVDIDSDLYVEAYLPNVYPSPTNRKQVQKCLYFQRNTIFNDTRRLESGTHSLDFRVPLPIDNLPSSQDMLAQFNQGSIKYTVLVKLGVREHGSSDQKEIVDKCDFIYRPHQYLGDYDLPQPQLMNFPFRKELHSKGTIKSIKGGWSSVKYAFVPNANNNSNSAERDQSPSQNSQQSIECVLSCPENGIRQDIANKFNLVIYPLKPHLTLTRIKFGLNEYSAVQIQKYGDTRLIASHDLLDHTLSHSGSTIDLGPMLTSVKLPRKLVPSFDDRNYRKFYKVKLTFYFTMYGGSPNEQRVSTKHEVDIEVLSPSVSQSVPQYQENLDLPVPAYTGAPPAYGCDDDEPVPAS